MATKANCDTCLDYRVGNLKPPQLSEQRGEQRSLSKVVPTRHIKLESDYYSRGHWFVLVKVVDSYVVRVNVKMHFPLMGE